ncbi:hypothetical protein ACOSP7_010066 [Xanthoceras sorbifolium]
MLLGWLWNIKPLVHQLTGVKGIKWWHQEAFCSVEYVRCRFCNGMGPCCQYKEECGKCATNCRIFNNWKMLCTFFGRANALEDEI